MSKYHVEKYMSDEMDSMWAQTTESKCFILGYAKGYFDMFRALKDGIDKETYTTIKNLMVARTDDIGKHLRELFKRLENENSKADDFAEKFDKFKYSI